MENKRSGRPDWQRRGVEPNAALSHLDRVLNQRGLKGRTFVTGERASGAHRSQLCGSPDIDIVQEGIPNSELEAMVQEDLKDTGVDYRIATAEEIRQDVRLGLARPLSSRRK